MVTSDPDLEAAAAQRQIRPRYLFGATESSTVYIARGDKDGRTNEKIVCQLIGGARRRGPEGQLNHVLRDGAGTIVGMMRSHADVSDGFYGDGALERTAVDNLAISKGRTTRANTSLCVVNIVPAAAKRSEIVG